MNEKDTILLLKECSSGIRMALDAFEEMMPKVQGAELREILSTSRADHDRLGNETHSLLLQYDQQDEDPGMMAKSMSWMKTNMKMAVDPGDDTIADLVSSGCDMGVRTLRKNLNKYSEADEHARSLTEEVIAIEETLSKDMRPYL